MPGTAETASAAAILTSSHLGMALSTTHVATGSILGTGLGKKGAEVRWGVAGRMVVAWVITLPAAAIVGGLCHLIAGALGPNVGTAVVLAILIAASAAMYARSRRTKVDPDNVNSEWQGGVAPAETAPATAGPANV